MPQTNLISTRPFRICREFGCNNLTKESYCKDHEHIQREKELERHKEYNKQRDPILVKFYNSKEWKTLSYYTLASNHFLCIGCSTDERPVLADVADHIIPVQVDWSLRLDPKNTQPLCHDCHNKKTAEDKRKYKGIS